MKLTYMLSALALAVSPTLVSAKAVFAHFIVSHHISLCCHRTVTNTSS